MNKKILIAVSMAVLLILVFFAGCELFDGYPERDNLNDPNNEVDYDIDFTVTGGLNDLMLSWQRSEDFPFDEFRYMIEISEESDTENTVIYTKVFESDNKEVQFTDADFEISYGRTYIIGLKGVDIENEDDVLFTKYASWMPEPKGGFDSGFGSGGVFTFNQAAVTSSLAYDLAGTSDNGIYIGAGSFSPVNAQFILKLTDNGALDNTFNGTGYYSNMVIPEVTKCAMLNSDFVAFLAPTTAGPLQYYKNSAGVSDTFFNYRNESVTNTDNGYILVAGGNADIPEAFSVAKFDQTLVNTGATVYSIDHNDYSFAHPVSYSRASDVYSANGLIYAGGWLEVDTVLEKHLVGVILNSNDMTVNNTLEFNADWDTTQDRVRMIGTTGATRGPEIAADSDGEVYVAARGIMSKFRDNSGIFDMDDSWGDQGSIHFAENAFVYDLILQENDKVLVFINQYIDYEMPTPTLEKSVIYRFNKDGSQDLTFNNQGFIEQPNIQITGADIKPDGHIIISGNDSGYGVVQQFK